MERIILAALTILILICLIALIDVHLRSFWGEERSALKALLLLFTILSFLYQIGFLLNFPFLFRIIDVAAILLALVFCKSIFHQIKIYGERLKIIHLLYIFLGYHFFLSVFAVPGLNWDAMVYHLARPFLYLNEGTIFTPHYADARQVAWPMGADVLTYLFTRHGDTLGVGFLHFIFYAGIVVATYSGLKKRIDSKTALTLAFVAASFPVFVYSASSVKNDLHVVFAFVMMWLSFYDFHEGRRRSDFFLIFLSLAFGLSCKVTFLVLGFFSLLAFAFVEISDRTKKPFFTGPKLPKLLLIFFCIAFIFLTQAHLYIYNFLHYGFFTGDKPLSETASRLGGRAQFLPVVSDFIKYQCMLIDFVLPLSIMGIPFIDTAISFIFNHTVGIWTGTGDWQYHYMPEEMRGSFGPFGLLVLWGIYATLFRRSKPLPRSLACLSLLMLLFISYSVPWGPVGGIRYFGPVLLCCLIFLPAVYKNKIFQRTKTVRWSCLGLILFCSVANYAEPLVRYHPKATPWHSYSFSDRGFLYHSRYFLDDRMELYQKLIKPSDKVFIFSYISDWVFPYYQYTNGAKVRLGNYEFGKKTWALVDFKNYDWVICNSPECIQDWDQKNNFEKVWQNPPPRNAEADFIEKTAAIYRQLTPPDEKIKPLQ